MLRRLLAVVVVWAGLLAISNPALACALEAAKDCCPTGVPPCGDIPADSSGIADMAMCCVAAPAPSTAISCEARVRALLDVPADLPDTGLAFLWFLALHPPEPVPIRLSLPTFHHLDDASLTYLHTQRLRL